MVHWYRLKYAIWMWMIDAEVDVNVKLSGFDRLKFQFFVFPEWAYEWAESSEKEIMLMDMWESNRRE